MKITIITSDQSRHIFFTNLLAQISSELYLIQEKNFIDSRLTEKKKTHQKLD